MENDQKICPRCGSSAAGYHFCPSCLAPVDSLTGIPAAARSAEATAATASETSATAVQVDAGPRVEDTTTAASTDAADISIRAGGASQPPPAVARLEDVLSVDPRQPEGTAPDTATAPTNRLEISLRPDARLSVPPPQARVARLEEVLRVDPKDRIAARTAAAAPASVEPPRTETEPEVDAPSAQEVEPPAAKSVEPPAAKSIAPPAEAKAAAPRHLPSYALRAAFLFEQSAAFKADDDDEEAVLEAPQVVMPEVDTAPVAIEEPASETTQTNWVWAICLFALIALVVVLTGRRPCRCAGTGR